MPIYAPDRRINPSVRRKGLGRKDVYAGLFLTSMVDMFAIMVIFLLQSFSSEGELIVLPRGLELPKAQNTGILQRAPSLIVSQEEFSFEGKVLGKTADLMAQKEWFHQALSDELKAFKAGLEKETQARIMAGMEEEQAKELEREAQKINISVDRRLPFSIVKKVIYNAGFSGFPDSRFAVFGGGKLPSEQAPQP